jgi:hypothetical protein
MKKYKYENLNDEAQVKAREHIDVVPDKREISVRQYVKERKKIPCTVYEKEKGVYMQERFTVDKKNWEVIEYCNNNEFLFNKEGNLYK